MQVNIEFHSKQQYQLPRKLSVHQMMNRSVQRKVGTGFYVMHRSIGQYSLSEAFEIICRNRHAEKNFSSEGVPVATVKKVI